jgi:hypothetical protein
MLAELRGMVAHEEDGWSLEVLRQRIDEATDAAVVQGDDGGGFQEIEEDADLRDLVGIAMARISQSDAFYQEFARLGNIQLGNIAAREEAEAEAGPSGEESGPGGPSGEESGPAGPSGEEDGQDADEQEDGEDMDPEADQGPPLPFNVVEMRAVLVDSPTPPFRAHVAEALLASGESRLLSEQELKRLTKAIPRPQEGILPKAPKPVLKDQGKEREAELHRLQCRARDAASLGMAAAEMLARSEGPEAGQARELATLVTMLMLHSVAQADQERSDSGRSGWTRTAI